MEKVGLEIEIQAAKAAQSVGDLRKAFDDAKKKAVEIGKAFGDTSKEFKQAEADLAKIVSQFGNFGKVKTDLRESKEILQGIINAYGATSKEAIAAAKAAAGFRDEMEDAGNLIKAFNPDAKFQAFTGALQSTVGGFAALQGAMGLFGAESKELEKLMLKVQSAMALSQGINSIIAARESFTILATIIRTQVVAAFATLRSAILTTGIGALVVGIGLLINKFMELGDAASEAARKQKDALALRNKGLDAGYKGEVEFIEKRNKLEKSRITASGGTEKQQFEKQQQLLREKLAATKRYYAEANGDETKQLEYKKIINDLEVDLEVGKNERLGKVKGDAAKAAAAQAKKDAKEAAKVDPIFAEAKKLNEQLLEENDKYRFTEEERAINHYRRLRDILIRGRQDTHQADVAQIREAAGFTKEEQEKSLDAESKQREESLIKSSQTLIPLHAGIQINQTQLEKDQAASRVAIAEQEKEHKKEIFFQIGGAMGALADLVGQQTVTGKALAIASTLISTYAAAQKAYQSQMQLTPDSPIRAAIAAGVAVVQGLARVKAIAAVKIPGKGGGSSFAGGSVQSSSGISGTSGQLNPALQNNTTVLDKKSIDDLANQALRAFVVESDVSDSQNRIQRIKRSAIFG